MNEGPCHHCFRKAERTRVVMSDRRIVWLCPACLAGHEALLHWGESWR